MCNNITSWTDIAWMKIMSINKIGCASRLVAEFTVEHIRQNKRRMLSSIAYFARLAFVLWLCAVLYDCIPSDMPLMKIAVLTLLFVGLMKQGKCV